MSLEFLKSNLAENLYESGVGMEVQRFRLWDSGDVYKLS